MEYISHREEMYVLSAQTFQIELAVLFLLEYW